MIAIFKREIKAYFHSFIGLLFIGFTLFFIGLYFTVYNLMNGSPYFSYAVSGVIIIYLISIPVLTMRILAEERKQKTDQLILTAPVTVSQIVIGKFLALSVILLIPTLIMCLYPLILDCFGQVPMWEAYLAILAFFLYGEVSMAIGIFVSSLTESQVIAAVISFFLLFLGFMMSSICAIISSTGNVLTIILSCFDLYKQFANMMQGTLNLSAIAYFVSVTILFLFLTAQSIQKRRYSVSVKRLSMGAYSLGTILITIVVTIAFNLLVEQIPDSIKSVDVTNSKLYSLTDDTKKFLDQMEDDVTIYALTSDLNKDATLTKTLERYEEYSKHIDVQYIDPAVNPNFPSKYTNGSITYGSLIIVSGKRSTVVDANDLYEQTVDYETYTTQTTGYDGEGQITRALDNVTNEEVTKVYMTTGHGEMDLGSNFTESLDKANIAYESINLMDQESIPSDGACLMIIAPVSDFSKDDQEKVLNYLKNGGKVLAVYGYSDEKMPNYDEILQYMGLQVTEGLVVETDQNYYYYQSPYLLLPAMDSSTYTEGIVNQYYIYAPFAQGIKMTEAEDLTFHNFLHTSRDAFSKPQYTESQTVEKEGGDEDGPFSIGVSVEKTVGEQKATLILFSCEQMFTDEVNQAVSGANAKMFINTANSVLEARQSKVSIPVKNYDVSNIVISNKRVVYIGVIATAIVPLLCMITGFVIWLQRRKQ